MANDIRRIVLEELARLATKRSDAWSEHRLSSLESDVAKRFHESDSRDTLEYNDRFDFIEAFWEAVRAGAVNPFSNKIATNQDYFCIRHAAAARLLKMASTPALDEKTA
jgi:DNA-binding GntR family transcriptional regulator